METEMLTPEKIIEELNEVLQIDLDAVGAYQAAIDNCRGLVIKNQLLQFKADHDRHVVDLKALVQQYGGVPKQSPDLKGFVQRGFTKVAGLIGDEATLRAMLANEKTTNDVYAKHLQKAFPDNALALLRRNYGDEQRHYSWIQSALNTRLWEQAPQPSV